MQQSSSFDENPAIHKASLKEVPKPDHYTGLRALRGIRQRRSILGAMEVLHWELGDVFRITLPGFSPIVMVGPEANRFVLVDSRHDMRWRMEREPITLLLRHGVLVEDDAAHAALRQAIKPALHRLVVEGHIRTMWRCVDRVTQTWQDNTPLDMLVEMRKAALLILTDALFGVDFSPEMARLWPGVLRAVRYISPGPWVIWRGFSHMGYNRHLRRVDDYLYRIIAQRRQNPTTAPDLLNTLIANPEMIDDLIRDQLMTMLIAGHDTSTAALAWALVTLGSHPEILARAQAEARQVLGDSAPQMEHLPALPYLGQCIDETLRLYPPIHVGSRTAARDLAFNGFRIPAGRRVLYSIYLTHRHPDYWPNPAQFNPSRFDDRPGPGHTLFLPFGGGRRNCVGRAFAEVEVKVVLARLLQRFDVTLHNGDAIHPHMGATLEPRPGVIMSVKRKT